MKPLFAIDLTTDKKNEKMNGEEFIIQRTSQELLEAHEKATETVKQTEKKAKRPSVIDLVRIFCLYLPIPTIAEIIKKVANGIPFTDVYKAYSVLIWISLACLVAYTILTVIVKKKSKAVLEATETVQGVKNLIQLTEEIFSELSVPDDAIDIDFLFFYYKENFGRIKPCKSDEFPTPYIKLTLKAFSDSENIYLAGLNGKYAIPLESITKLYTCNDKITFWGSEKDMDVKFKKYKEYERGTDTLGRINNKGYHILEINRAGEPWEIYLPYHELPQIEQLTGLKATQA